MPSILSDSNSSGINPGTLHPDPDPTPDPAPDPDPDPDPAPERSTVALSGFSALKTPITQRSSPQTPPNAPKRPPRASPRVGGLVSECAGPALTLTRLSLSHGACAGTRWLLGTVLALVARGHVVPREHARCGAPPQVQAAGRQPRSTRASRTIRTAEAQSFPMSALCRRTSTDPALFTARARRMSRATCSSSLCLSPSYSTQSP